MTSGSTPNPPSALNSSGPGSSFSEPGRPDAKSAGYTVADSGRPFTHVLPGSSAFGCLRMLGRAFDDMNYALTCKQRQESLPEALVKAAESLLQAGLPERYWPVFFTAYGPDDDTNINAAELLYVVTGTPSELEPKPWATIGREVETLREFGKGKPEYEFLESSLKEVQEATQKIAMELRGGDYDLTDPASRAEEAKTAIADALAWTELESKAQEARDTIMARTRANYGWTIDESSLRHFSVTTSVEAAREALTNVEPPPWPGESRADEPLQALRDELIAVSGNPEKWNKDLQNSLLAFEKSATAPYNRLLNALHGITLALSSENGEESFIHGVEELEEIAKSTKDREESTWNPMLKKLACIIPDVKTLSARTFTTSPSERDLHPSAVANSD